MCYRSCIYAFKDREIHVGHWTLDLSCQIHLYCYSSKSTLKSQTTHVDFIIISDSRQNGCVSSLDIVIECSGFIPATVKEFLFNAHFTADPQ